MKKYTSNIIITLLLLLGILSAVLAIKYDNTYLFNCLLFFTALSKGKNIWEELIYKFRKPTDELRIPMRFDSGRNFFGWIGIILFLMGGGIHFHDWYWNIDSTFSHYFIHMIIIGLYSFSGILKVPGCQLKVSDTELRIEREKIPLSDIASIEIGKDSLTVERKNQEPLVQKDLELLKEWPETTRAFLLNHLHQHQVSVTL